MEFLNVTAIAFLGISIAFGRLFDSGYVKSEYREDAYSFLNKFDGKADAVKKLPDAVCRLFDKVFLNKKGKVSFVRSMLFSTVFFFFFLAITGFFWKYYSLTMAQIELEHPIHYKFAKGYDMGFKIQMAAQMFGMAALMVSPVLLINAIADFPSVLITKFFIEKCRQAESFVIQLRYLFYDAVLSLFVFFGVVAVFKGIALLSKSHFELYIQRLKDIDFTDADAAWDALVAFDNLELLYLIFLSVTNLPFILLESVLGFSSNAQDESPAYELFFSVINASVYTCLVTSFILFIFFIMSRFVRVVGFVRIFDYKEFPCTTVCLMFSLGLVFLTLFYNWLASLL